jgi:hypothetical protein
VMASVMDTIIVYKWLLRSTRRRQARSVENQVQSGSRASADNGLRSTAEAA